MSAASLRRAVGALILGAVSLAASPAEAQANGGGAREQARALFEQGRAAVARGDCERAAPLFRESQRLYPANGTLLNLAVCERKLGQLGNAWRHLQDLLAVLTPEDPRRKVAQKELDEVEPRVPWLRVEVAGSAPERVALDGAEVALDQLQAGVRVNPGERALQVTWPGGEQEDLRVSVAEKEREVVRLAREAAPAAPPPAPVATPPAAEPPQPRWPVAVAAGVALTGVATGVVFTLTANQRSDQVDVELEKARDRTPSGEVVCPRGSTSARCARISELLGEQDTFTTIAGVGYIVGGLAAVGGVALGVWSFRGRGSGPDAAIAPVVTRHGGGLRVQGSF